MTLDTIEADIRELDPVPQDRALVVPEGIAATGALALAALTDEEFERRLNALRTGVDRIGRIQKALMTVDVHYGVIPGTRKPTLLKPGAEVLCLAYSLAADFTPERRIGDGSTAPALSYVTRCDLHLGNLDGPTVAVGYGAANSWEARYRYRQAERVCPSCGQPAIIKGKAEYGGGWVCFKKKGGCGAKYADRDVAITGQEVGQVDNPDPWDLDVTLAKMAEKRAHVDATLRATGASALFTQDVEDLGRAPDPEPEHVDLETGEIRNDSLIGIATKEAKLTTDFQVRQEKEFGWFLGFRIKEGRGTGVICEVRGPLALVVSAHEAELVGQRVQAWGSFVEYAPPTVKHPYRAFRVDRLTCGDLTLPSDDAVPSATAEASSPARPVETPAPDSSTPAEKEQPAEAPEAQPVEALGAETDTAGAGEGAAQEFGSDEPSEPAPAVCGAQSPYDDDETCDLLAGHRGVHKRVSAPIPSSWPTR
jgi:hypothetical protein